MNSPFTGHDTQTNRKLVLYSLADANIASISLGVDGQYFIAMLVWDAESATDDEITAISRKLIDVGCAYLCCWGNGCERVHDLFDSEWVANGFDDEPDDTIMTTWHDDDTLDEFIYFSMLHAEPTNKYRDDCNSIVAFVIDGDAYASRIREVFTTPSQIYAKHNR